MNASVKAIANIQMVTEDQTRLRGMYYSVEKPSHIIVVASATGVPQGFYKHFANAANEQGFDVLTFDYRGIGQSAPKSLKGYEVNYLDWGRQDLAAAVNWAYDTKLPVYVVGHSYGGHAIGLLPNHNKIEGAYVFGTGAGWAGWMPMFERLKVSLMWHVIGPILVARKGYLAWSSLGMGEDLPKGVFQQWKHWCSFPHYFFDDPKMKPVTDQFQRYEKTLIAVNASDDKWAQPSSRDAFMAGYKNANVIKKTVAPSEIGLSSIDHMGYFRRHASALWQPIFNWVADNG
jgi:predicted alpha/beta hydrolase